MNNPKSLPKNKLTFLGKRLKNNEIDRMIRYAIKDIVNILK